MSYTKCEKKLFPLAIWDFHGYILP